MEVKLQLLEIFPPLSDLIKDKEKLTFTIFSDNDPQVINIQRALDEQSIITIKSKEKQLKFSINKNNNPLGNGEYTLSNETRWLTVTSNATNNNNSNKKKSELFGLNLIDCIRLRLKCELNDNNSSNIVQPLIHDSYHNKRAINTNANINYNSNHLPQTITNTKAKGTYSNFPQPSIKTIIVSSSNSKSNKSKKKTGMKIFKDAKRSDTNEKSNNYNNLRHNNTCEDGLENKKLILTEGYPNRYNMSFHRKNYTKQLSRNKQRSMEHYNHYYETQAPNMNIKQFSIHKKNLFQTTAAIKRLDTDDNITLQYQSEDNSQFGNKKLDEEFKTYEDMIIDKNFENNIKNDEIINENKLLNRINSNDNIADNDYKIHQNKDENKSKTINNDNNKNKKKKNKNCSYELESEEYNEEMDNYNFHSLKEDFEIFYTKDYVKTISKEMRRLELQLLIEKICELQDAFHKEIIIGLKCHNTYKNFFKNYSEKYLTINKAYLKLKDEQEKAYVFNTYNSFIGNYKLKYDNELIKINENEIKLWNKMPLVSSYTKVKTAFAENKKQSDKTVFNGIFKIIMNSNKNKLTEDQRKWYEGSKIYISKHARTKSMIESELNHNKTIPLENDEIPSPIQIRLSTASAYKSNHESIPTTGYTPTKFKNNINSKTIQNEKSLGKTTVKKEKRFII